MPYDRPGNKRRFGHRQTRGRGGEHRVKLKVEIGAKYLQAKDAEDGQQAPPPRAHSPSQPREEAPLHTDALTSGVQARALGDNELVRDLLMAASANRSAAFPDK